MGTPWLLARREMGRRWSSLLGLAVLVAIVGGALLTAVLGAHRTATSIERFRGWSGASDVLYQSSGRETAASIEAILEDLPEVEQVGVRHLVNAFLLDESGTDVAILSDPGGAFGRDIDRPRVVEGRAPRIDAPDEVLLNELAARVTGLRVGDTLVAQTWSEADLEALFLPQGDFPGFNGPRLELDVVGIGRTPEELPGDAKRGGLYAFGSPAFLDEYRGVGVWPPAVAVRLRDGGDIEAVTGELGRQLIARGEATEEEVSFLAPTTADEVYGETTERTVDSLSLGLLVFAASAAVAGAIAIGPAITRQIAGSASSTRTLRALGLTSQETALTLAAPIVVAATAGVVAGAALAVALSSYLPIGLARRAEVEPGPWIEPFPIGLGVVAMLVALVLWSWLAARRAGRMDEAVDRTVARRASRASRAALRAGATPTVAAGVRLASDRGRGEGAVPVRSAFVGVAIAIAGVLGAGVIATSFDALRAEPSNWGWNWSTLPDYFGDGDISALEEQLLQDERVEAVAESVAGSVMLDGSGHTAYSMRSLKGSISYRSVDGRLPSGPGEVALGRQTLEELGLSIGDSVRSVGVDGVPRELVVVGTVVLPPSDEYRLDVGAVLTPEGREALEQGDPLSTLALRYPEGADVSALEAELASDYGFTFSLFGRPQVPGSIRNLTESRDIAIALGGFFVAIGAIGLLHALAISTRRRRGDLAVLRALGLRRRQVPRVISTEAITLTVAGIVVGAPAGLAIGRLLWRLLVDDLGVVADPQVPWLLIAMSVPAALVVALAVAWWPGRMAVRARPAESLRAQ